MLLFTLPADAQDEAEPLQPDTRRVVTLDGKTASTLVYEAQAPQVVTITVESVANPADDPLNDPVVTVIKPDGGWLAYNDNHRTVRDDLNTTDAMLRDLLLPEAGHYKLRINTYGGIYEGEIAVTLAPADRYNAEITEADDGIQINARLPRHVPYNYTFQAEAGDRITLTARDTSRTLDPVLTLYGPDGNVIQRNDDHSGDDLTLDAFDAQLQDITLPAEGAYRVQVADMLGRAGTFALAVHVTPPDAG